MKLICRKTGLTCDMTGCNAQFCGRDLRHFSEVVTDEQINILANLHYDRIKSQYPNQPIKALKKASNAKFHFQEGMKAILSLLYCS